MGKNIPSPEGVSVVFDFPGADAAAGREDMAVRGDFGGAGGFAEAGEIFVGSEFRVYAALAA